MPFPTATANKILNKILKNTDFTHPTSLRLSLHTADPGDSGTSEITGGGYVRLTPTIGTVASKAATTTVALTWTNMPACTLTHVGLWDQAGGYWWKGVLTSPKPVAAGATFTLAAGDCDFNMT